MGATTKVMRIKSPSKLVHMRQTWDTETQKEITGDAVRRVAAQEAQIKNTLPTHSPDLQWVRSHMPVSNGVPAKADKVALGARKLVIQESDDQEAATPNICQHHSICADCCGPIHGILHPWWAGPTGGGGPIFLYMELHVPSRARIRGGGHTDPTMG